MELTMDLKQEWDDRLSSFAHSNYSTGTASFSSASSIGEPFTPTSGRSTPHGLPSSMGFDLSLQPAGVSPFDITPPPSAGPCYFPMEYQSNICLEFAPDGLPRTPTKLSHTSDFSMGHHAQSLHISPAHSASFYNFPEMVSSSPFASSLPTTNQPLDGLASFSMGIESVWGSNTDSPISFLPAKQHSSPAHPILRSTPATKEADRASSPVYSSTVKRQVVLGPSIERTSALQRVQQSSLRKRTEAKPERRTIRGMLQTGQIETITSGAFKCDRPGCHSKPFKRNEHLKRHINTTHSANPASVGTTCLLCKDPRSFNRHDNWRQHMKLHVTDRNRKTPRVKEHPDAQRILDEDDAIKKTRKNPAKPRHNKMKSGVTKLRSPL